MVRQRCGRGHPLLVVGIGASAQRRRHIGYVSLCLTFAVERFRSLVAVVINPPGKTAPALAVAHGRDLRARRTVLAVHAPMDGICAVRRVRHSLVTARRAVPAVFDSGP